MASGVDQNGATSKQELARDALLELVGGLEIGVAIPSERRLATRRSASRGRRCAMAIDELVREGLLLRRHGSGTYVAEPKIALPLTMTSFSEDMRQRGMRPGSRVLSFESPAPAPSSARACTLSPADRVWVIPACGSPTARRWRSSVLHVPSASRPEPHAARPRGTVLLRPSGAAYGTVVVAGTQTIEPTVTNEEEAEVLGVPVHAPGLPVRADQHE